MNDEQLLRYSRQIMLPQFDVEGQQRLLDATALIVGAGGLGCPAAMYLASAGVGKIILVDNDEVDLTNLQRQIAHTTGDIGQPKTVSLKETLRALNPDCRIDTVNERIDEARLNELLPGCNVVLDCTDNFDARFAISAACVKHQVPLATGAAIRFEGQLMVYDPRQIDSPCYRCLYPDSGEIEETCSDNGVLAPVVGIIGSMQALEAIKLMTGIGDSSSGKLVIFDGLSQSWRILKTNKDLNCPVCQTL